ncbi:MAG: hypothetical protein ACI915_002035 [Gammaproteobacteria bacterium]|jgi:hypothetical protein
MIRVYDLANEIPASATRGNRLTTDDVSASARRRSSLGKYRLLNQAIQG